MAKQTGQTAAASAAGALEVWAATLAIAPIAGLGARRKAELTDDINDQLSNGRGPSPLDGLMKRWRAVALTSGGLLFDQHRCHDRKEGASFEVQPQRLKGGLLSNCAERHSPVLPNQC